MGPMRTPCKYYHINEICLPRLRTDPATRSTARNHKRLRRRFVVRWGGIGKGGLNF